MWWSLTLNYIPLKLQQRSLCKDTEQKLGTLLEWSCLLDGVSTGPRTGVFLWKVHLCRALPASPQVTAGDEAGKRREWKQRACWWTASNYPSACCLLGNCTYSFIPFCVLKGNTRRPLRNLTVNRRNCPSEKSLLQEMCFRLHHLKVTGSAEGAAERRSYLMSWWRGASAPQRRWNILLWLHEIWFLPQNVCFTFFSLHFCLSLVFFGTFAGFWKNTAPPLKLTITTEENVITDYQRSHVMSESSLLNMPHF